MVIFVLKSTQIRSFLHFVNIQVCKNNFWYKLFVNLNSQAGIKVNINMKFAKMQTF